MKITIIGSTQYKEKFIDLEFKLRCAGHQVRIPAFDDFPGFDELMVCEHNRDAIEWADKVYLIWDNRSQGTVFDFGMCFMARKPLVIEYIEPKTLSNVMRKYAEDERRQG